MTQEIQSPQQKSKINFKKLLIVLIVIGLGGWLISVGFSLYTKNKSSENLLQKDLEKELGVKLNTGSNLSKEQSDKLTQEINASLSEVQSSYFKKYPDYTEYNDGGISFRLPKDFYLAKGHDLVPGANEKILWFTDKNNFLEVRFVSNDQTTSYNFMHAHYCCFNNGNNVSYCSDCEDNQTTATRYFFSLTPDWKDNIGIFLMGVGLSQSNESGHQTLQQVKNSFKILK